MGILKWIAVACIPGASTVINTIMTVKAGQAIAEHTPIGSLKKSFVDNVIRDKVIPDIGSIVHCSMYGVEHTGVYIGDGQIVALQGNGKIKKTTPSEFTEGTNAISIYVACDNERPISSIYVAELAISMIGGERNYHMLLDNCHQFTVGCITGNFDNADNYFFMVESEISKSLNNNNPINWRVWDINP